MTVAEQFHMLRRGREVHAISGEGVQLLCYGGDKLQIEIFQVGDEKLVSSGRNYCQRALTVITARSGVHQCLCTCSSSALRQQ